MNEEQKMEAIIACVCESRNVSKEMFYSNWNHRHSRYRAAALYLIKSHTKLTYQEMAYEIGRTHTAVISAIRRVAMQLTIGEEDAKWVAEINEHLTEFFKER